MELNVLDEETFELELTAMAHGGSALGRHDKQTVFVPYTIPGERVLAQVHEDRGRVAFAEGLKILDVSADRVFPQCPHFGPGRCGRCQWQHIAYEAQILLKQDVLADQLSRVGKFDDETIDAAMRPLIPSEARWGYLHHLRFEVDDADRLGLPLSRGAGVLPIEECHILHPDLLDLWTRLDFDTSKVRQLELRIGSDGEHMVILRVDDEEDAPELTTDLDTSINLILPDNVPVNLIGDTHSTYTVGAHEFRVTVGSAFRPHVAQLEALASTVQNMLKLGGSETLLDLYGGVGFFSAFLAESAGLVTLVESYPPAATDADVNLSAFDNVDILEGRVEDVLESLDEAYDAAILDPPAAGLSIEVMDALAQHAPKRLVYVSSDPATLARDGQRLLKHGYRLEEVQPIDLAPQTYFIDCAALFTRS